MYDQITLPNGLRVIGERLDYVRSCNIGCWVKVGSRNELPEENGLSHFIEHMVFKGTTTRSARDIAEEMDMVGGQLNAFTSKECTCFYAKVTDDELRLAVDLVADLVLRPVFDAKELNKERGVVLEEISMVEDTPDDLIGDVLADVEYSGSLHMPILGPAAQIRTYSREDLVHYWSTHYTPKNMVLSISGHYDWEEFLGFVNQYFNEFPNPETERLPYVPQHFVSGCAFREKDVEQEHICIGFPGVESHHDDKYPLNVFSSALGGGMSSRLFQRIREELGMAYSVFTFPSSYKGVGTFNAYAGTNPGNAEKVLQEMYNQIRQFVKDGITEKEFRSAKAQLRGGFLLGLESASGRMQALGRNLLLHDTVTQPDEIIAKIDAVTMDSTMELARRLLDCKPCIAIVGKNAENCLNTARTIFHG